MKRKEEELKRREALLDRKEKKIAQNGKILAPKLKITDKLFFVLFAADLADRQKELLARKQQLEGKPLTKLKKFSYFFFVFLERQRQLEERSKRLAAAKK